MYFFFPSECSQPESEEPLFNVRVFGRGFLLGGGAQRQDYDELLFHAG